MCAESARESPPEIRLGVAIAGSAQNAPWFVAGGKAVAE